ncbi:SprT family protein [Enterococcus lactis]|nr:SprT family protein [Enterococcus lactis]
MTQEELQQLVEEISLKSFQRPFKHQAMFNPRLRTTGGRYHLNDHHLDFNAKLFEESDKETITGIIKHELCHYHLHLTGRGYRHKDMDFKYLLKKTGGLRLCASLDEETDKDRILSMPRLFCHNLPQKKNRCTQISLWKMSWGNQMD